MNIKSVLKSSVAAAALVAIAAPVAAPDANAGIKSSGKNSLAVGGYVTRSLMYADDGTEDQLFITDGGTSESRIRWIASGKLNENVSAGAGIELEIPNSNRNHSAFLGDNGDTNADKGWENRHNFVWVSHKQMGKLSLGNTNAAANGATEASLAGVGAIQLSGGATYGLGLEFVDPVATGRSRSGVKVGGAFSNFDMTSRTDVLRYDAPKFGGLSLAASLNGGGGTEVGAKYSGKFGGIKALVKAGYTNTSGTSTTVESRQGISGAVLHDSGINASVSWSEQSMKAAGREDPQNVYVAVGYIAKVFGTGKTHFNVAWNETSDLVAVGDEANALSFTVLQKFDAIGAHIALNYENLAYERAGAGGGDLDDIDVITLNTQFNF
ncbi:MAG: hypothetical protein V3R37_04735 [Rhodospirillales bacterium]